MNKTWNIYIDYTFGVTFLFKDLFQDNYSFYFYIFFTAATSMSCCPTTSLPTFSATNSCFLTSAAAAAMLGYVHGCPL